ncbi:MAG: DUF1566 domain-containing protein [Deltaproteobacteria bacterium]|jgi:hypothetical protein|nr:DUF1566 domain-containing protein [Deltaproteobacteria bacterium]
MKKIFFMVLITMIITNIFAQENGENMTLKDQATGLTWQSGENDTSKMKYDWAKSYCESIQIAGKNGWRLPTVKELLTLIDYKKVDPATSLEFETIYPSYYWSSEVTASYDQRIWAVNFKNGAVSPYKRNYSTHVRCVHK